MGLKGRMSEPQECKPMLRKNLRSLYNAVFHWANPAGLQPIGAFLELPSKEEYPTYTTVVAQPICMNMVEMRLKGGLYRKEQDLMADLMLMFANCRFFNQEMSQVFQDADTLEQVLVCKAKQLNLEVPERPMVVARPILANPERNEQTPRGKGSRSRKSFTPKSLPRKRKVLASSSVRSPPKMKKVEIERESWEAENLGRRSTPVISYLEPSLNRKMRQGDESPRLKKVEMRKVEIESKEKKVEKEANVISYREPSLKSKMRQPADSKPAKVSTQKVLIPKASPPKASPPKVLPPKVGPPIEKFVQPERRSRHSAISLPEKIKALYNTLKYYKDAKGFLLSSPFMKLPSKAEYPDYYQVIRQPLDLQGISRKRHQYETLEDAVSDFVLVFDNAMQYNMEGSQIYRDAKTLARVAQHWRPEAI